MAFSRILNEQEVLIVANTSTQLGFTGEVIVEASLNDEGARYDVLLSNRDQPRSPSTVLTKPAGSIEIHEPEGAVTHGPARVVRVDVQPLEIQFLRKSQ